MVNYKVDVLEEGADNQYIKLKISGDISVSNIRNLKQKAGALIHAHQKVDLIVEDVEFFDLSSLQLIYALQRQLEKEGGRLSTLFELSDEYNKLIELSGFSKIINHG